MTPDEKKIQELIEKYGLQPNYEGEIPFGYELVDDGYCLDGYRFTLTHLKECNWTPEERIQYRITYLRNKLIDGTITPEEKEELKLLIG